MKLLFLFTLLFALAACVPQAQYDALVTERNYYRNQSLAADSLAGAQLRTTRDSITLADRSQRSELRQIEDLTATNRALEQQLRTTRDRYEQLVAQEGRLATAQPESERALATLRAELTDQQAALERRERELSAREARLASLPTAATVQAKGGGEDPMAPAATRDRLAEELRQVLLAAADTGYTLTASATEPAVTLRLADELLFGTSDTLTLAGEQLLREMSTTLRAYPRARVLVVGHVGSQGGDPRAAYRRSTQRAAAISLHLARLGLDPGRLIAGGTGFYGATGGTDLVFTLTP
ncbi:hypothetical protein [Neolewinella sp.]|uniref:hypothetical protein n=1 Tax=Neolewinella sp. TaxID=2993543 RepID=UPI003B5272A4